eukprot:gene29029-32526_t
MQLYSNAFNFDSYLSGGVDPRTGQYGSQIRLVTVSPEGPVESSRDIALSFSMMEESNSGYGLGWHLSLSEYDENAGRLRLLSGQIYNTQPSQGVGNLLIVPDQKLQDMAVRQIDMNTVHVLHKDGVIEVLRKLRQ